MARLCWTTNGTSSPVSTQTASLHSTFSSMSGITGVSKTVYISAKTVGGTKIDTTLEGPDFLQSWRPSTTPPFQFTGFYPIHRSHSGLRPTTYSGSQTTELICWQSDFAVLLTAAQGPCPNTSIEQPRCRQSNSRGLDTLRFDTTHQYLHRPRLRDRNTHSCD